MSLQTNRRQVGLMGLAMLGSFALLVGCAKSDSTNEPSKETSSSSSTDSASANDPGRKVFDANGCARCHSIGGGGRGRAPELTHVGADPTHTAQWIADHVKNPKTHNPNSRMPAYEGKISDADLQALSTYLAGLK